MATTAFVLAAPAVASANTQSPLQESSAVSASEAVAPQGAGGFESEIPLDFTRGDWVYTSCMTLTDSIDRLYSAYYQRSPEREGFEYWMDQYATGSRNLERISEYFTIAPEFVSLYGSLDDLDFIELAYINVMERAPDAGGWAFWHGKLQGGMTRGEMMLYFSESEEYVIKTGTATPLAGYLAFYPEGTRWQCGTGSGSVQLSGGATVDLMVSNWAGVGETVQISIRNQSGTVADTVPFYSEAWMTDAFWGIPYGAMNVFEVEAGPQIDWAAVTYPGEMATDRSGWLSLG